MQFVAPTVSGKSLTPQRDNGEGPISSISTAITMVATFILDQKLDSMTITDKSYHHAISFTGRSR